MISDVGQQPYQPDPYDPENPEQQFNYRGGYPRSSTSRGSQSNYPAYQQNNQIQASRDRYGINRSSGKFGGSASEGPRDPQFDAGVGRVSREGVRGAVFDVWGNLIGGKDLAGNQVRDRMPMSGIDRFKLANEAGWAEARGIDPNQIPEEWRLTPNIDRYEKQFRDQPQMTSWGQRWSDAVAAAHNQDNVRDQYHAERLAQYHNFQRALAERRAGRASGYSGYSGGGGIRGGSTGSAYSGGGYGGYGSYSVGGGGIRGGSTGSAYSSGGGGGGSYASSGGSD